MVDHKRSRSGFIGKVPFGHPTPIGLTSSVPHMSSKCTLMEEEVLWIVLMGAETFGGGMSTENRDCLQCAEQMT